MRKEWGDHICVSYQNSFPQWVETEREKMEKKTKHRTSEIDAENPPLHLVSFCQFCQQSLAYLGLQFHNSDLCLCLHKYFSTLVCVCLYVCTWLSSYKNIDHIGLGFILFQYDLILTNYSIFRDNSIFK